MELEKVANAKSLIQQPAKFQFSDAAITKVATALVENGILKAEGVTKFASRMKSDPNFALETLEHVSTLSPAPVPSGRGLTKTAGSLETVKRASQDLDDEEMELARDIVKHGA